MKNHLTLSLGLCILGTPLFAQTPGATTPNRGPQGADNTQGTTNYQGATSNRPDRVSERYGEWSSFGPSSGDWEFTLGGSGLSNNDMDNSSGGVSASAGVYLNDTLLLGVRQSVNYVNPNGGDSSYAGSTRLAIDQHILATGRLRPFVGVNFGGVYGEDITNTFVAGLEAGAKFYVQPRTFLYAMVDYAWAFRDSDNADDNFSDGGFQWSLGVGFNF